MSAVAKAAGVATGTAYTYYDSKEALLLDAYVEVKRLLGTAAVDATDSDLEPSARFSSIWMAIYRHLSADPAQARFLVQVESSPLAALAHKGANADGADPLVAAAEDIALILVDLPLMIIYELGLQPAIRLAADQATLDDATLQAVAAACWRSIANPTVR